MAEFMKTLNTSVSGSGGWGNLIQGAGAGIMFGAGLGKVKRSKRLNRAADMMISAGRKDAGAVLERGEIQAGVDTSNAYAANFEAAQAEALAAQEAAYIRKQARQQAGAQAAAVAGSGAAMDGPVLDIISEDLADMEAAAYRAIYAGELRHRSLREQSQDFLDSAENTRRSAKSEAEQVMAEAALRAHQLQQQRKQEVMDGIGGMLKGAIGIFGAFKNIGGSSSSSTSSGGGVGSLLSGLFGGGKGNTEVSGLPWLSGGGGSGGAPTSIGQFTF